MALRAFAAGLLVGLLAPAVIVLGIIRVHESGALASSPTQSPAAPTATPVRTPIPALTRTPIPTPTRAPAPTKTPTVKPTPSPTASPYQVEKVEVPPGRLVYVAFSVPERYTLDGYFTISGGNEDIWFWATGREGETVIKKENVVGRGEFSLSAKSGGTYTLYFDNSKSMVISREVAIYYRLKPD